MRSSERNGLCVSRYEVVPPGEGSLCGNSLTVLWRSDTSTYDLPELNVPPEVSLPEGKYSLNAKWLALIALLAVVGIVVYKRYYGTFPTPPPPPFQPPAHEVLIANQGSNSITGHAMDPNGSVSSAPGRIIGGGVLQNNTGLRGTFGLALGGGDRIYAANQGDVSNPPSITVYAPDANGNVVPTRTISGAVTGLVKPQGLALRSDAILVANWVDPPDPNRPSGILEFSMTPGEDAPRGSISGRNTSIAGPGGVALDLSLRVYVSEPSTNRILVFEAVPGTNSNRAPSWTIEGSATGLDHPTGLAFDSQGSLYVTNMGDSSITVYPPNARGNAAPSRRIGGPGSPNSGLNQPFGITVDSAGRIFVTQGNSFLVFDSSAAGNASPLQIITDSNLNYTTGVAVR